MLPHPHPPHPTHPPTLGTLRKLNFTYDPDSDCAVTYQMIGEVFIMGTNGTNYARGAGVVATSASVESGYVPGKAIDGQNTSRAPRAIPRARPWDARPRRWPAPCTSASTPPRAHPPDQALSASLPALATAAYYSGQAYTAEASWLAIDLGQDIAMSDISTVAMDITALNNNGYERDQSCLLVQWISDTGAVLQTNRNNRVRMPQLLPASLPACNQSGSNTKRHQPLPFAPAGPAVRLLLLPRAGGRYATTLTWVPWVLQLPCAARLPWCSCRC
jgi:hypothetical protein